jgi:quinohemoprotein ethanol dehydrogenase
MNAVAINGLHRSGSIALACALLSGNPVSAQAPKRHDPVAADAGIGLSPNDWPSFGRTPGEQHYSPLTSINDKNVERLGLAWSEDLPVGHTVSEPVAAGGMVFTATGHSFISAFDAMTGTVKWTYDTQAAEKAGYKLRQGYGTRGLAYADGHLFVATHDGRLISLDAKTGAVLWSVLTTEPGDLRFIAGAPRVFGNRVIIGHGGGDGSGARGYVTAYDKDSGKQLWRFFIVPGNPADGFEEPAMEMAAKTWFGKWWQYGGGGTAWNAFSYDPELSLIYIGTGNGYPYSQALRSENKGDNLFLASIVAVKADTGKYVWHYQVNPAEQWDYNATMDMTLATIAIEGKPRKVLMQAPKNGFFYVLDRINGKLISAEPFAKVTWALKIDLKTGRPDENPGARYHDKDLFEMWPSVGGAHSWLPQSFDPKTGLVYIPVIERGMIIGDKGIDEKTWKPMINLVGGPGVTGNFEPELPGSHKSFLKAWDPIAQKARWTVETPGDWPGGTMATAGNLVFQGQLDHKFNAYAADTGKLLWTFDAKSPIVAPPVTYAVEGKQYVSVLTGNGSSGAGFFGLHSEQFGIDYRTMPRRILTFALGGTKELPAAPPPPKLVAPNDSDYHADAAVALKGLIVFHTTCAVCHGFMGHAAGAAPDLRTSPIPATKELFEQVVKGGAYVSQGMPKYDDLPQDDIDAVRQYIRSIGQELPKEKASN